MAYKPEDEESNVAYHDHDLQQQQEMRARVSRYAAAPQDELRERLDELENEWDLDRVIEANGAAGVLLSLLLGRTVSRKFYGVAGLIGGFMLQQAYQRWSPPTPMFRKLGYRTPREIEHERNSLLTALRSQTQAQYMAERDEDIPQAGMGEEV